MNRVVITGLGIISPLGSDVKTAFDNAIAGVSGIDYITKFDASELKVKIAAQVKDFNALDYIAKREIRRQDLCSQYAVAAATQAYNDAGLNKDNHNPDDLGVWIGTGMGGLETFARDIRVSIEKGINKIPPMFVPMIIPNMPAGNVAIALNAKNTCSCTTTACSAGTNAIGDAFRWIKYGDAKIMLAGGTEAGIVKETVAGFNALSALSTNEDPKTASRPFDKERDGFVLGEGSGVIVLEELEHALARNAKIYGEVFGYGSTCDAFHITSPSGEGAVKAIEKALKEAKIEPKDIDYINAHGTSTPLNDKFETKAIKDVFKEDAYKVNISSTKSMHGHALGGAGGIEAVLTTLAIQNDICPPTINYHTQDEELDLNYTPNKAVARTINYAMSNSLGFGGHNAIIVLGKYGE
ncbi:beta-ketoacyl-ACP synthase II [Mycoplasma sp. P36-A1]|uniref:beta-ketoacyl-ACP synthase II n=1 Tax=Mycoplasma sp. P36-A1 TaxID=3252900 RepID=UPI003C30AE3D